MSLPTSLAQRLTLPLIAAPMLHVSGPALVSAACRNGVVGAFPTVNARSPEELDAWLTQIELECSQVDGPTAPVCPNIIMRRRSELLMEDVRVILAHRTEMIIASVGSPEAIVKPMHDAGCLVFADVASLRHVEKALEAGADGLVLLTAGAGGQTGWANGLSFVRAVRRMFDGPIALAGGISDGAALWATHVLGCDLGMMGTRFIATKESMAAEAYKQMLVRSTLDDVMLTQAFTGLNTNMLRPSIVAAGMDPKSLAEQVSPERARELFSAHSSDAQGPKRWVDIWSAGHSVSGVEEILSMQETIKTLAGEYAAAQRKTAEALEASGFAVNRTA